MMVVLGNGLQAEDTVDGGQGNSPFDGGNGVAVAQSIGAGLGAVGHRRGA